MATEVVVGLISAIVALIGTVVTFSLGIIALRIERQKLNSDRERLKLETERLQAEVAKMSAETSKLRLETNDALRLQSELRRSQMEVEKEKELILINRRYAIYPEILELVYRLRNSVREFVHKLKDEANKEFPFRDSEIDFPVEEVYILTDNLYKYRAFIDEPTFDLLHRYKRIMQDARVFYDLLFRGPLLEDTNRDGLSKEEIHTMIAARYRERIKESLEFFEKLYSEVDALYVKITQSIKDFIDVIETR